MRTNSRSHSSSPAGAAHLPAPADLPAWLADLLDHPPQAGTGVHAWLFRVARQLHAHMSPDQIIRVLQHRTAHCGRLVPLREIQSAVRNAMGCAWSPAKSPLKRGGTGSWDCRSNTVRTPKWPSVNEVHRAEIVNRGPGLADLLELSPISLDFNSQAAETVIDTLFPGNPLLCCGKSKWQFDTRPRENWRGQLHRLQFIVPSPMCAVSGLTREGRPSRHTLSGTGPRRFLVVEFDSGSADEHAAILLHLAAYGPLVLAVHSGGKSLHGWFDCAGRTEEQLFRFMRYAVSLGADPHTWPKSQFVRMPGGMRDNGKRQEIYWFKPQ